MIPPLPCIIWSKNTISSPSSSSNEPHLQQQSRDWLTLEETPGSHLAQPPPLKQGYLQPVAQHDVQAASECLQGWRRHSLSVPVFDNPHSKNCFLTLRRSILCPLSLVLAPSATEKCLTPVSLHFPFRYFYTLMRSTSEASFGLWSSGSLSLSLYQVCSSAFTTTGPPLDSPVHPHLLCSGGHRTGCIAPVLLNQADGSPLLTCRQYLAWCSKEHCSPSLKRGHAANLGSMWCPPESLGPLLQSCFPATQPQHVLVVVGLFLQNAFFGTACPRQPQ